MVAFGGFFTGPSDKKGTMPGFAMNNETFLVRFEEIQIEKLNSESQVQHLKDNSNRVMTESRSWRWFLSA